MQKTIPAGQFKTHCLALLDEVAQRRKPIVITKRGKPIARLVPVDTSKPKLFGRLRGSMELRGDIVGPLLESWEADE